MNTQKNELFIFVFLAFALIGIGIGTYFLNRPDIYLAKDQLILPGTGTIDFDDMRFGGNEDFYRHCLFASDIQVDYRELKFNADRKSQDIFWSHETSSKRSLIPCNRTELAILELEKDFNDITLEDLTSPSTLASYSKNEIIADDDPLNPGETLLKSGTIIAIKTSSGNFGKMRIDEYLSLKSQRWDFIPGILTETQNYNLLISFVLFNL